MFQIARDGHVPAAPEAVWNIVSDPARFTTWFPSAGALELLAGDGLDRRQRLLASWGGRQAAIDQTVTALDSPRRLAWRHDDERLNGRPAPRFARQTEFSVQLDPADGGTRVALGAGLAPVSFRRGLLIRLLTARRVGAQMDEAWRALPVALPVAVAVAVAGDYSTRPNGGGQA